jgi:hypothetical protein
VAGSRRCCVVWVSEGDVLTLFGQWSRHAVAGGCIALPSLADSRWEKGGAKFSFPDGVEVERATHSWERRAFGLLLSHPSFPEVPEGELPPDVILTHVVIQYQPVRREMPDGPLVVEFG